MNIAAIDIDKSGKKGPVTKKAGIKDTGSNIAKKKILFDM